jgi:hypothetical protein
MEAIFPIISESPKVLVKAVGNAKKTAFFFLSLKKTCRPRQLAALLSSLIFFLSLCQIQALHVLASRGLGEEPILILRQ